MLRRGGARVPPTRTQHSHSNYLMTAAISIFKCLSQRFSYLFLVDERT